MATAKSGKKTISILAIVCTLVISTLLLMSLIPTQEAYADKKKITGTSEVIARLARTKIPVPKSTEKGRLDVYHAVMKSDDPDWNNARFFFIIYDASLGEWTDKVYGVITHPGGDQTFIEIEDKMTSETSASKYTGVTEGFFLKGTGKFENIRARWKSKWAKNAFKGERIDEWTVEYF